jgi:16S rRNA (cytidine1402-2'-O)-methyltransferase
MPGTLYIVSTPIGNLKDITIRALDVLKNCDYILAESSARTAKLLHEYNIEKKIITFNKDNEKKKKDSVLADLSKGLKISLVTDAGTPLVSDPGYELTRIIDKSINLVPIPGPSSLTCALSVSRIPINNFMFLGFLPKKASERCKKIIDINNSNLPAVVFESKHRVKGLVKDISNIMGKSTVIGILREMTKIHETISFHFAEELLEKLSKNPLSGEITMIIDVSQNQSEPLEDYREKIISLSEKYSASEVVSIIRLFSDVNRKELYKYVLKIRQEA